MTDQQQTKYTIQMVGELLASHLDELGRRLDELAAAIERLPRQALVVERPPADQPPPRVAVLPAPSPFSGFEVSIRPGEVHHHERG